MAETNPHTGEPLQDDYERGFWAKYEGQRPKSEASDEWMAGWYQCRREMLSWDREQCDLRKRA